MTTLETIDGAPVLRFERALAHPAAKVWKAVSDPAEMANWFPASVETELKPGAPMRFTFPEQAPVDGVWDGEVLEYDPPKVFAFRWNLDVLRFEIVPDGENACVLHFSQVLGGDWVGRLAANRNATGWDVCLDKLNAHLAGEEYTPPTDWLGPMERYAREFGLDEGEISETGDGYRVHFARDLVWKPLDEVWQLLTGGDEVDAEPPLPATNGYVTPGEVTDVKAPEVLEYQWLHDGEPAGTVRWEFVSDPKLGVRVELTQTIPLRLADFRATALAAWHVQLELFFAATHGDIRCPWPEDRTEELRQHYARKLG